MSAFRYDIFQKKYLCTKLYDNKKIKSYEKLQRFNHFDCRR